MWQLTCAILASMPGKTTLAAGVMAGLSISALFAQDKPRLNSDPGSSLHQSVPRPPLPEIPPMHLPATLSECESQVCGTWQFTGERGSARWPSGAAATLTALQFNFDGVIIHRIDTAGSTQGLVADYRGKIQGNHIEGEATWSWPGHWNHSPKGQWSATIVAPAGYSVIDPGIPCDSGYLVSPAEALERGVMATDAKKADIGVCWLRRSASDGNATAQGLLAAILYKGIGVAVNLPEAVSLAQKASQEGNYVGERCLSLMYASGQGLPKEAAKAEYWRAKAQQDKLAAIQAEETAERNARHASEVHDQRVQNQQAQLQQARQRQNVQGMLMLGLLLGAFASDFDSDAQSTSNGDRERQRLNMSACGNPYMSPAACGH